MIDEIEIGKRGIGWNNEHRYLQYTYEPISQHQKAKYVEDGYSAVTSFVGETYSDILPPWVYNLNNTFGLHDQQYEFMKIRPLDIAPPYNISTARYKEKYNVDKNEVWHAVLMLEDWQPGQYIEINGQPFAKWVAGDWFKWQGKPTATFSYSNVGQYNYYILCVTGKTVFTGQLNELLTFNFPGIPANPVSTHPFIQLSIIPEINPLHDPNIIWAVYMDNGYIKQLDNINFTESQIELINKKGIHIYLFEVMCSYYVDALVYENGGTRHTQGFYSEFEHPHDKHRLRVEEFDAIMNFKQRNSINDKMIHVHTCDYNVEKHYPYYSENLTLLYDDLYVRAVKPVVNLNPKIDLNNISFSKHAVSLNWRYCKHRQLVANFLAGENVYLSWYFRNEFDLLKKDLWFNLDSWKEKNPNLYQQLEVNNQNIMQHSPYCVDKIAETSKEIIHPHHVDMWPGVDGYTTGQTPSMLNSKAPALNSIYNDCFVDIVTETRFAQPTGNFSEKVLQPVQYMKPFILLAPPYTLECLKSFGYKTFEDFWDESYDTTEDHGDRLAKIFTIIKDILERPPEALVEMYKQMYPILEHNRNTFLTISKYPNYITTGDFG